MDETTLEKVRTRILKVLEEEERDLAARNDLNRLDAAVRDLEEISKRYGYKNSSTVV